MQSGLRMGLTSSDTTAPHSHKMSRQTCLLAPLQLARRSSVCTFIWLLLRIGGEKTISLGDLRHPLLMQAMLRRRSLKTKFLLYGGKGLCTVLLFSRPGLCIERFWHQPPSEHSFSVSRLELCSKTLWGRTFKTFITKDPSTKIILVFFNLWNLLFQGFLSKGSLRPTPGWLKPRGSLRGQCWFEKRKVLLSHQKRSFLVTDLGPGWHTKKSNSNWHHSTQEQPTWRENKWVSFNMWTLLSQSLWIRAVSVACFFPMPLLKIQNPCPLLK